MRSSITARLIVVLGIAISVTRANAELPVEPLTTETLPATAGPHWMWLNDFSFSAMSDGRAYLLDGDSGTLLAMLSTGYAFGGVVPAKSGEIYSPETYFSRGTRGTRTDVITVYEPKTLAPGAEIVIPPKRAAIIPMRNVTVLTDDQQFLLVYNFTPAQSVSVVDVKQRTFVGEIETAGCALIYPSGPRSFFSLCPDGSTMTVTLGAGGKQESVLSGEKIFDLADPVTEKGVRLGDTWYFVSFAGEVYSLQASPAGVQLRVKWSLTTAAERAQKWTSTLVSP